MVLGEKLAIFDLEWEIRPLEKDRKLPWFAIHVTVFKLYS